MKDSPYQQTIDSVHNFFMQHNFNIEILSGRNPLPNCWSHTLLSKTYPYCTTNGKGECKKASIASSYGEFIERFATGFFFADYGLQKKEKEPFFCHDEIQIKITNKKRAIRKQKYDSRLLTPNLLEFYDPDTQLKEHHLLDNNYDEKERGILAVPFYQLSEKEKSIKEAVYFPIALLNNLYVSNGMAAGNSRFECINQALSEIFERYVKFRIIAEGVALPDIDRDIMAGFPKIISQVTTLEKNGYQVRIKDASLGGVFPVICVLLLCPDGGAFASFGCSCRLQTALGRTITEMVQGRELAQLQGFEPPVFARERYSNPENLESHFINSDGDLSWQLFSDKEGEKCNLSAWDFSGNSEAEFYHLHNIVKKIGATAYIQEYNQFPLYVCRIIIPGISEIYPVEDLIENNCNKGGWLRQRLLKLPTMKSKKLQQFIEKLDKSELPPEELVSHCIGIFFAEDSLWASLQFGELRAMAALSLLSRIDILHDSEEHIEIIYDALQWCEWAKEYSEKGRDKIYQLLTILLFIIINNEKKEDYHSALQHSFSTEERRIAEAILSGDIRFWGLIFAGDWYEVSTEYQNVVAGFDLLKKMMNKQ